MAKYTATIAADNSTGLYICDIVRRHDTWCWFATVGAQGTFGSGTVAFFWSIDGGTTLLPLNDLTGTAITLTVNGAFNSQFGDGSKNSDNPKLYIKLTGSTNPSLTIFVLDNR